MCNFSNDFGFCPALRAHRVFALRAHRDPYTPLAVTQHTRQTIYIKHHIWKLSSPLRTWTLSNMKKILHIVQHWRSKWIIFFCWYTGFKTYSGATSHNCFVCLSTKNVDFLFLTRKTQSRWSENWSETQSHHNMSVKKWCLIKGWYFGGCIYVRFPR